jgi:large subunit ribosomal protein L18
VIKTHDKQKAREKRKLRISGKVRGNAARPRLSVFKSARHIYAQIIDDDGGQVLAAASTLDKETKPSVKHGGNIEAAKLVGKLLAERARDREIEAVNFDRNGFRYHGRVKALADAAREAGLKF